MKFIVALFLTIGFALSGAAEVKPLKILQVSGGCCHDYKNQQHINKKGLEARINCTVDNSTEGKAKNHRHSLFDKKEWAKGYDIVMFNICFGGITDDKYITDIVAESAKNGKGVMFLHCSLHTFRNAKEGATAWRALMGLSSKNHGKKSPILVENLKEKHPIMIGFPQVWQTPNGELYNIFAKGENVEVLARGHYPDSDKYNACIWTNKYQESKVFGMSLGHHNETMEAKEYQDVLGRGALWTVGKLKEDGKPAEGFGK
ncbi:MAG: ThuA domain-containing protein [Lentisphaeraceae bacterium]|nr:ThuA domain-containing protein [Lentisphaeraceae bacterium]